MKPLIKIINLYFWKSIIGPFFAFAFPIIFIAILGMMLGYSSMFGGLLMISSMSISLTSMPQAIFEFKRSSLLKRIGVTPIKPWMFVVIAGVFYLLVMIVGTFFSIIMGIAIFSGNMNEGKEIISSTPPYLPGFNPMHPVAPLYSYSLWQLLTGINWGGFIWSLLLNILIGLSIGMFLVSVSKSTIMIQGIGIPVLILSQFLSAQVLPPYMVREIDAIWYLGYISPFKSTTILMFQSWNPSITGVEWVETLNGGTGAYQQVITGTINIFDMDANYKTMTSDGKILDLVSKPERYINMFLPFIWVGLFSGLSIKYFKWSTRG